MKQLSILCLLVVAINLPATQLIVPKDYSKIQTAIDKAEPGDTISVKNGIYHESITLKDSVFLIGESALKTIIRGNKREPVVKAGDKSLIKNFSIENGSKGILCENVIPTIRNCIIRDNKGTGVHCLVALPDILNNLILSNDWTGIYCESSRSMKSAIQHNIIAENGYCGILLSGNSEILVQNNVIISNKQYGVWGEQGSKKSRVIYNDFYSNRSASNFFILIDKSNLHEDPQYPLITAVVHNYFDYITPVLKGKGKDGATIGMMNDSDLTQFISDPDLDGVVNDNDQCKDIPEDIDKFQDQDGCPDFDNDKDGIFDNQDLCPDSAEDFDNFRDDDGCPDLDNDKDGIVDSKDLCPTSKETINNFKDDDGCPDEAVPNDNKDRSEKNNSETTNNVSTSQTETNDSTKTQILQLNDKK